MVDDDDDDDDYDDDDELLSIWVCPIFDPPEVHWLVWSKRQR